MFPASLACSDWKEFSSRLLRPPRRCDLQICRDIITEYRDEDDPNALIEALQSRINYTGNVVYGDVEKSFALMTCDTSPAEELAMIAAQRMIPWIEHPPTKVAWTVVNELWPYQQILSARDFTHMEISARCVSGVRASARCEKIADEIRTQITDQYEQDIAKMSHTPYASAVLRAANLAKSWVYWEFYRKTHKKARDQFIRDEYKNQSVSALANVFEPLLAIWSLGFAPYDIKDDTFVLAVPRI